ncbi:MAG: hypothetical protein ACRCVJ_00995 [Clostridium sp.]
MIVYSNLTIEPKAMEVIEESKKDINKVNLKKDIKDIKEVFINDSNINFEVQLSEYEFLVNVYNKTETETEKKVNGFGDRLYKYNIKTGEYNEYLKATNEDYIINQTYLFDKEWLIWIESNVVVNAINETIGGNYNIVCKNIKNDEMFFIEKKTLPSDINPKIRMLVNPVRISYSKNKIAYTYFEISGDVYQKCYKTFDLKTKEGKLHFKGEDYFDRTLSEISIFNDMISFTESNYKPEKENISKLYYFNINEQPKVFKEIKAESRLETPLITENVIYTNDSIINDLGLSESIISAHNIKSKKSDIIISDEKFKGQVEKDTTLGNMELIGNNLCFYSTIGGSVLYDIKNDKIVELYNNDLFNDKKQVVFGINRFDDYVSIIALQEGIENDIEQEYLIKYK